MESKLIFCVLFGIFIASSFDFNDAVVFKFTNVVCESFNKSWFVFHNCRLKAVSRSKVTLNMNATILHPTNDMTCHAQMFKRASGYKPWLMNIKLDVCLFLRRKNNPFFSIVYSFFKDLSNFNHTCPYGAIIVKDVYLRPELLRLAMPTGDYLLSMKWYYYQKHQFDMNFSFTFVEDLLQS
ncbi:uncharacterized protein LOC111068256 isoform X2 [Drosophila obscura]|uniref:uncharacterized protein LOC111068256 isoform X2 n=1 Tax=Drosophila obscura TaxID=7282 RepID=UPI000BA0357D|nr:uncharacterized protein LOC111068256 isoform X2 [Drosophila obscura]